VTAPGRKSPSEHDRQAALIFRDWLLPYSETFILSQAEALVAFRPVYVGSRRIGQIDPPVERTIVVNDGGVGGRLRELAFKLTTRPPSKFLEALRQYSPRLLHAHFGPDGVRSLGIKRALGIPLVVTFHGSDANVLDSHMRDMPFGFRQYVRHRAELVDASARVIAVCQFVRKQLLDRGFREDRTIVHHVGVDTKLFSHDPQVERERIVLFVGRLHENKGCRYLIDALSSVQQRIPEVELVVIGDGPERAALEAHAAQALGRYRFLGRRTHDDVRWWLDRAWVVGLPSVTIASGAAEGLPTVATEGQSMGVPVVGFATAGIPEVVEHGVTGLLAPERDVTTLGSNLVEVAEHPDLWHTMSANARARMEREFDLERQTHRLEEIYREVLDGALGDPGSRAAPPAPP
jgi:glycosyltransferase involved in cell wall biosynthesis